jgi:hypothetical protein
MILVELETGNRRQFGSAAELAEAVRRGELRPGARIYHQATARWIPIDRHPAFRENWVEPPLPPLTRARWTFFAAEAEERPTVESKSASTPQAGAPTPATTEEAVAAPVWRRVLGRASRYLRPHRRS